MKTAVVLAVLRHLQRYDLALRREHPIPRTYEGTRTWHSTRVVVQYKLIKQPLFPSFLSPTVPAFEGKARLVRFK
jgi:hypothetical protein